MKQKAIELKGITKIFGTVIANEEIDLTVDHGEILALLGENGSGKTTLMNVLSGIYAPDGGSIYIKGEKVSISGPEDSKLLGIGMVHQHFKLVENFSAADNIWIGAEGEDKILRKSRYDKIRNLCEKYGFDIDPQKKVYDMSVSEKQTVEILKVLYYGAQILILDEPTAVLTIQEIRKLFSILRKMKRAGCAVIIITHKLNEVLEISDRVTILRKGRTVGDVITSETNIKQLTSLMVGRPVELSIERPDVLTDKVLLELKNVTVLNSEEGIKAIDDVSFDIKSGEILGVAGISGCGQKELCEAIAGLIPVSHGQIIHYKQEGNAKSCCTGETAEYLQGKSPREIIKSGISMSFIPEDRLGMGLAASLGSTDNMMLKNYKDSRGPFVDRKNARKTAQKVISELNVSTPGTETPVRRLSGGNVQKVLIGREMEIDPNVMITAYPVRGLDINSSYTIYDILNKQKTKGVGILFIGEDIDVMLELCDRIMVLCHGRVTGIVDAKQTNKEELGLMMTGAVDLIHENKDNTNQPIEDDIAEEQINIIEQETPLSKIKTKEPFLRIIKRDTPGSLNSMLMYTAAVVAAIIAGGLYILLMGFNPINYYNKVITGCFDNSIYINGFLRLLIPLIIASLAVAMAFKMKFWNLGVNGQFIAGAVSATTVGLLLKDALPQIPTLIILMIAGAVGGGLFGLIPAFFKVKFGTSETLLTLMLNYIAYYLLSYFKTVLFFRKLMPDGSLPRPDFKELSVSAHMIVITIGKIKIDASLLIALFLIVFMFIYFKYTKQGYEINVVGDSKNTANYAGMNVKWIILRTMFISGAIAGIAGMFQATGSATNHTLSEGISGDVGWTGIIVAWLAKLNPVGILITSVLIGILQKGSAVAESVYNIPSAASDILQGIILFTVLISDFFIQYKVIVNGHSLLAKNRREK